MNNIIKLLLLDKAMLKPFYKYYIIVIIAPILIMVSFRDIVYGMMYCMCIASMTCAYTFQIAEKNDISKLYGIIPVSRANIVTGRYIFNAVVGIFAALITFLLNIVVLTVLKVPFDMDIALFGAGISIFLYFLYTSIQLPGYFKFGAIKGRAFTFIPLLGIMLFGFIFNSLKLNDGVPKFLLPILSSTFGVFILSILGSVVIYCISIGISKRIYQRMET